MNTFYVAVILATINPPSVDPTSRSEMPPSQLILGEWRTATKTYSPDPEFPNSRVFFTTINKATKTGTRTLRHENGEIQSSAYSIEREDKMERVLEISIHLSDVRKRKTQFRFDKTGKKMIERLFVTESSHIDAHHLHVTAKIPKSLATADKPKGSGALRMVRVAVYDDTMKNPVHPKAEIWFRGYGSWWLKPELKFGGTVKNLGTRPSGSELLLIFYPESRDGRELSIPYLMTDDMSAKGSPRDMISVDISDTEIVVHGLPIKAATGEFEQKYER